MARFQTPTAWLMTDARFGARLIEAIAALPAGAGVVLRDPHHPRAFDIAALCHARRLMLAVARDATMARALGAILAHNPPPGEQSLPFSLSVHSEAEAVMARRRGAALAFVSPVHATDSHLGAATLGEAEAVRLALLCGCPAIALGGMNAHRFKQLGGRGFVGWAGIDAWL